LTLENLFHHEEHEGREEKQTDTPILGVARKGYAEECSAECHEAFFATFVFFVVQL
jgi:hypothetical protein